MYFIPKALMIKATAGTEFWATIGKTSNDFAQLTWENFFTNNLLPVTIGNIIGRGSNGRNGVTGLFF